MTRTRSLKRVAVVGGAGFIGSHVVAKLLTREAVEAVTVYDNFSSGRQWHLEKHINDRRLQVVPGEIEDETKLESALDGCTAVVHLASNPDIARAAREPEVDFLQGTALTQMVFEGARRCQVPLVLYASGSGVYGDLGETEAVEDHGPMVPVSTYGASKLAGEALLSSYCHMFGMVGYAFRFGNVVGPRQTHGVGYDFIRRLASNPESLSILGDGSQSKSYVHVTDAIDAMIMVVERCATRYQVFNVATGDYIAVAEIANLAAQVLGLEPGSVAIEYSGGDRGWKGDVPVVRISTSRIRSLGWANRWGCHSALKMAMEAIAEDVRAGKVAEAP